ncbi:hypothetical protein ABPG77_008974 [Micractinium sp. CCAP 211/92]
MQALSFRVGVAAGRALNVASNGSERTSMKARNTYQVQVVVGEDEPQDNALKRFRREVMTAGVIPEVRRRRYFENAVDAKKRKTKEARMAAKRQQAVRSFAQVAGQEPAPFSDMFGTGTEDLEIFI